MDSRFSPRLALRTLLVKPPFIPAREEELLSSMFSTHLGPQDNPGDFVPSANWPFVAPGVWGAANALSPKSIGDAVARMLAAQPKPPVLYPPQPMVSQTRAVLEKYAAAGGRYQEVVIQDAGHVPFIEKPDEFNAAFHAFLTGHR